MENNQLYMNFCFHNPVKYDRTILFVLDTQLVVSFDEDLCENQLFNDSWRYSFMDNEWRGEKHKTKILIN